MSSTVTTTNDNNNLQLDAGSYRRVDIIRDATIEKTITCAADVSLDQLFVLYDGAHATITIDHTGTHATSRVKFLLIGAADTTIHLQGTSYLSHPDSSSEVTMTTFVCENARITVDGGIHIRPEVHAVAGHLHERNIVLAEKKAFISSLPRLDVRSSDVQASHGATIDRLDPVGLFYLMSKGIPEKQAKGLMIDGRIQSMIDGFALPPADQADIMRQLLP